MLVYVAASLLHFVHNGIHLHDYPHMPAWLTSAGVYAAWGAISALGACGYWLYRRRSAGAGRLVIGIYGLCGLGALEHYALAPVAAHSWLMNLSIAAEALAAAALLLWVVRYSPLLMRVQARVRSR
jgi:hypothetical protein